jgi:poly-gamma-glutamate synthesis protein (capsule biosynthesis protein)
VLLRDAGFDLVSLANNHLLDWGVPSVLATLEHLRSVGLEPVGAWPDPADGFQPVIRTVHGVSVGFLAYSMWLNVPDGRRDVGLGLLRTDDAVAEIAALRPYVDFIVVLAHWERENDHFTYGVTRELAHAMVDAGADVVLGHHAHVLKGLEWYRGALIAYSLGNFVFGQVRGAQAEGAVLQLELVRQADGGRRIAAARLIPVVLEGPRSIPRPAEGRRRRRLLTQLRGWSRPLETLVEPDGSLWPGGGRPHQALAPRFRAWLAAGGAR